MINYQDQLKLQAYLDKELSTAEARALAQGLAREPEAAALLTELRQTGEALQGFEQEVKLPESREFYWSKLQRQLQPQTPAMAEAATPSESFFARWRRLLMPATGVAVAAVLALLVVKGGGSGGFLGSETAISDSGALTYHDFSVGATLVWLSYPADDDGADTDELSTL